MKRPKIYATKELGKRREAYGSQGQFAEMLRIYDKKITRATYAKYESGERPVPVERAMLIASFIPKAGIWTLFEARAIDNDDKE